MLAAAHRVTDAATFSDVVRQGRRVGSRTLVVHVRDAGRPDDVARAGFVVSKAVGGAVVRNQVRRRLRHIVRELIDDGSLPGGSLLVVRALPASAQASSPRLRRDLQRALATAVEAA